MTAGRAAGIDERQFWGGPNLSGWSHREEEPNRRKLAGTRRKAGTARRGTGEATRPSDRGLSGI